MIQSIDCQKIDDYHFADVQVEEQTTKVKYIQWKNHVPLTKYIHWQNYGDFICGNVAIKVVLYVV